MWASVVASGPRGHGGEFAQQLGGFKGLAIVSINEQYSNTLSSEVCYLGQVCLGR